MVGEIRVKLGWLTPLGPEWRGGDMRKSPMVEQVWKECGQQ